ncbi:MAG: hypothetical protein D3924_08735 [Candidatus Electrothrix sp. AR4]|nr:hypothetical protein [Candidatus Electrothrix sp. AR4]
MWLWITEFTRSWSKLHKSYNRMGVGWFSKVAEVRTKPIKWAKQHCFEFHQKELFATYFFSPAAFLLTFQHDILF